MNIDSDILELKFTGNSITPSSISVEDLAKKLLFFNDLVKPIILANNPGINLEADSIGFVDIGNRSLSFRFLAKKHKEAIIAAYAILLTSISTNNIDLLPIQTIETLEEISKFNSHHGCVSKLGWVNNNGDFTELAHFTDNFKSEKIGVVKGNTTIYGEIESIGGTYPHLILVLDSKDKIRVSITKDQVHKYAQKIYSHVSINGEATWKGKNLKLTSLKASDIDDFTNLDAKSGFDFLSSKLGDLWDKTDTNKYLS